VSLKIIMGLFDFLKPRPKPKLPPELEKQMNMISLITFPRGEGQIQEETGQLHALLRGKISKPEAKHLLVRTKALIVISEDKSKERIVPSIINATGGQLTEHEASLAFQFFTGVSGELYGGGDGSSQEQAVVINATSSSTGIHAEYQWLEQNFGKRDEDWMIEVRRHGESDDGRYFEAYDIKLADGTPKTIVFDISSFFGRF
ncbi:hypothetical protein QEH58_20745, partial [Roseibacillus persicicus]|nr:hypothetical protein [Roseibacillus persicicus]